MKKIFLIIISMFLFISSIIISLLVYMKLNFMEEIQKASQIPYGETCISVLGTPIYQYDGSADNDYLQKLTQIKDNKIFANKKVYFWRTESFIIPFKYIMAVVDKETDKVTWVAYVAV